MVLSMHLQDLGLSGTGVGWAWSLATASEIGIMAYAPRFSSGGNAARLLLLSLVVQALRWALMSVVTEHAWLFVLQGLHAVSFGLRWVACMLIVSRFGQRVGALATIQGLHLTATSLGSVIGMFLAGFLFERAGGARVFAASAGLAVAGAVCALGYSLLAAEGCALICTTGGTGPAPRDVTPEAMAAVCQKMLPGFGEKMRAASLAAGVPTAILSRQSAGIIAESLVVNLPGKPASIRVCLDAVFPAIPYCIDLIGGPRIEGNPSVVQVFRPK